MKSLGKSVGIGAGLVLAIFVCVFVFTNGSLWERKSTNKIDNDIAFFLDKVDGIEGLTLTDMEKLQMFYVEFDKATELNPSSKSLIALRLVEHAYNVKSDEIIQRSMSVVRRYGDRRCLIPLKESLALKDFLSPELRGVVYGLISDLGGISELDYLRSEYSPDKLYVARYLLACELASYGDDTGAPTFIEGLTKNKDEEIRAIVRKQLVKLYAVDHGDDIEAWKQEIEKRKADKGVTY